MNCLIPIIVIISACGALGGTNGRPSRDDTLLLVHTIFRHGDRTPTGVSYTNNPINSESFFPEGYGQLTNNGKRTEYRIGTTLRSRYNRFLGPTWNISLVEARTTNVNRTKMSLSLVLAGLWPPQGQQRWQPYLNWQPIPYNYYETDKELQGTSVCTNFATLLSEVQNSAEIQEALSVYNEYYEYVYNHTGQNFSSPMSMFGLYFNLITQKEYGYPLEKWLDPIFPDALQKMTKDVYYIYTNTTDLRKLSAGYLIKKIINDSQDKINGDAPYRKMFLYSAHEMNVADLMLTLGVYDDQIPSYGAHVILELHKIGGVYGFQVFHQDWTTRQPRLLTIPGCQSFCPFDEFVSLLEEVIPDDDFCTTD